MTSRLAAALCVLFLLQACPLSAAEDEVRMPDFATRLALTPEQQQRIAPALEERNRRLAELRGALPEEASRRERLRALREARTVQQQFVEKVNPVLTEAQRAQWQAQRDAAREGARERLQQRRATN